MCTRKRLYWKGHCTLLNTLAVSLSVLAALKMAVSENLLQVAVDLEAVVPRVCHRHMAIRGEGQALGAIKRVC